MNVMTANLARLRVEAKSNAVVRVGTNPSVYVQAGPVFPPDVLYFHVQPPLSIPPVCLKFHEF